MSIKPNKRIFLILILCFLPFFSFSAFAETTSSLDNVEMPEGMQWLNRTMLDDRQVYQATLEACSQSSHRDLYGGLAYDNLYAGIFPSHRFNELIASIQSEAFKKNTIYITANSNNENQDWLLTSSGFRRAVNECYNNEEDRQRFTWLVERRSSVAETAGFIVQILVVTKGIGAISRGVAGSRYLRWIWGGSLATSVAVPTAMQIREARQQRAFDEQITASCGDEASYDCMQQQDDSLPDLRQIVEDARPRINQEISRLEQEIARNPARADDYRATIQELRSYLSETPQP